MNTPSATGSGLLVDAGHATCIKACPHCNGSVYRTHRRFVDLLMSIFIPIRRYRCDSMLCDWEGNLREKGFPGEP